MRTYVALENNREQSRRKNKVLDFFGQFLDFFGQFLDFCGIDVRPQTAFRTGGHACRVEPVYVYIPGIYLFVGNFGTSHVTLYA